MKRVAIGLGLLGLLSLTACASGGPMSGSTDGATSRPPFATAPTGAISIPSGSPTVVPEGHWAAILDDLDARGVTGAPTVVSAESMTWNNGALGCPKPGMSYTQSLIEGMRVVVSVDDDSYDYRFGSTSTPMLCER